MVKLIRWSYNNASWHNETDKGPHYALYIGALSFSWMAKGFAQLSFSIRFRNFYRCLSLFWKTITGIEGPRYYKESGNPNPTPEVCAYLGKLVMQFWPGNFERNYDRFYCHLDDFSEFTAKRHRGTGQTCLTIGWLKPRNDDVCHVSLGGAFTMGYQFNVPLRRLWRRAHYLRGYGGTRHFLWIGPFCFQTG